MAVDLDEVHGTRRCPSGAQVVNFHLGRILAFLGILHAEDRAGVDLRIWPDVKLRPP